VICELFDFFTILNSQFSILYSSKNRPFFGWRRGGYLLWQPGGHDLLGFRSLALRPWFSPGLLFLLGVCQLIDKNLIIFSWHA
jgi:hypothetical protein